MGRWGPTVNVTRFLDDEEDFLFEERRDGIVQACQPLKEAFPGDWGLEELLDSMGACDNVNDFDDVWYDFYAWADDNRVWVNSST